MSQKSIQELRGTSHSPNGLAVKEKVERFPYIDPEEYEIEVERTDEIHLRSYLNRVWRHKWIVISVTVLLTAAAAIYLFRQADVYEAQTRIQVDYENNVGLATAASEPSTFVDRAYFNTQLELLTSPSLIRQVVKKLDLESEKNFFSGGVTEQESLLSKFKNTAGLGSTKSAVADDAETDITDADALRLAPYVKAIQESLSVQPVLKTRQAVKDTRLIEISFTHPDPQLSAKITNALADELVESNLDKKMLTNTTENKYLRDNISELQSQIRRDEERLLAYGRNYQLPTLDGSQNTVAERLVGLNRQLLEAENERKQAEAAYKAALEPGAADALAEENAKQITEIDAKLDELRQRRAQLLVEVTEKYPEVQEVDRQITVLEQQARDRRSRATNLYRTNLETRYRQALNREQAIRAAFEDQRAKTLDQNEAAINYRIIQQSIETNKKLLDSMTQRSKENEMLKAKVPNNIRVVDYALTPTEPVDQKRLQFLGLAFVFAFSLGIGGALMRDYFDTTVHTTEEVEKALSLPALAVIPRARKGLFGQYRRHLNGSNGLQLSDDNSEALTVVNGGAELIVNSDAHSPINEAFRRLRTALLLSPSVGNLKKILVTSSQKAEGKTTTAANIATSLSQTGASVLIIDADLRSPRLDKIFNLQHLKGLSDILAGGIAPEELPSLIVRPGKNFAILPAGVTLPNSAEWLGSDQMHNVLRTLEPMFDYIVIDSPPVTAFADSTVLASMVDGVLLVVQGNRSSQEMVRYSTKLLRMVGAKIVGVVLNKVSTRSEDYYYGYRNY